VLAVANFLKEISFFTKFLFFQLQIYKLLR
jgi:hypothetical protein